MRHAYLHETASASGLGLMPYIPQADRKYFAVTNFPTNPGQLNYVITKQLIQYILTKGESYQTYNDIVGVLECAKLELYRRRIAPYENKKIKLNGDL